MSYFGWAGTFIPKSLASCEVLTFDSVSNPASFQVCNPPFKIRTFLTPAHLSAQFTRKAADVSLEYNMIVLSLVIPCFNKFFFYFICRMKIPNWTFFYPVGIKAISSFNMFFVGFCFIWLSPRNFKYCIVIICISFRFFTTLYIFYPFRRDKVLIFWISYYICFICIVISECFILLKFINLVS